MQLYERGLVRLDDDVSELVPVFAKQQVLTGFADDGTPILVKRQGTITLRLLLSHTTGTGYYFLEPRLQRYMEHIGKSSKEAGTIDELFDLPLLHQPGEGWTYGPGISWAGKVIEKVTGQSLEAYMQENIFKPLGISRITFFPQENPALANSLAGMNVRDEGTGKLIPGPPGLPLFGPLKEPLGGEGAWADLRDYLKILHSLLLDDEKLLKSETAALLFQPQLPPGQVKDTFHEATKDPKWSIGDFSPSPEMDWAYGGVAIVGDSHPIRRRGYLSWGGAANLFWVCMPPARRRHFEHLTNVCSLLIAMLASAASLARKSCRRETHLWSPSSVRLRSMYTPWGRRRAPLMDQRGPERCEMQVAGFENW